MKNPRLLKASLLLNLILLGAVGWLLLPTPSPAPLAASVSSDLFLSTQPAPAPAFHWSQLEAGDYPTYIARLRTIGCPEETIRDLITADVTSQYEEKRRQLSAAPPPLPTASVLSPIAEPPRTPPTLLTRDRSGSNPDNAPALLPDPLTQRLQTLTQEQTALLAALLPPPPPATPPVTPAITVTTPAVPAGESSAAPASHSNPTHRAPQDMERQMRQRGVLTHEQEVLRAKVGWLAFYYTTAEENAQERASSPAK